MRKNSQKYARGRQELHAFTIRAFTMVGPLRETNDLFTRNMAAEAAKRRAAIMTDWGA